MSSRKKAFNLQAFQELFTDAFSSGLAKASARFYRMAGSPDMNKMMIGTRTALHYAASRGNRDLVKFCLERGANPNIVAPDKSTPLTSACEKSHFAVAKALIAAGADVNHRDLRGNTAFMITAQHFPRIEGRKKDQTLDFIRELVRNGADSELGSYVGTRPFHFVRNHRDKRLFNYISDSLELHLDRYVAQNNVGKTDIKNISRTKKWDRATVLTHAVAAGKLDVLVERMKALKVGFVISDFSEPISERYSTIDAILKTGQTDCLMDIALWQNKSKALFRFISMVPTDHAAHGKLLKLYNEVQRQNVSRSQARNKRPKLG